MLWHDFINTEIDYDSPADDDIAYLNPFENMTEEELSHYYYDVHSMTATVTPENKNDGRDLVPVAVQLNLAEENDSPMDDDVINLFDSLTDEGHNALAHKAPTKSVTGIVIGGNIGDEGKKGRNSNNAEGGMSAEINEAVKLEECKSGGESESVRRPTATGKKCPCLGCGKKN